VCSLDVNERFSLNIELLVNMAIILDGILLVGSYVGFFIFGWFFFAQVLFKNFEITSKALPMLFSLTLSVSCSMFELIIFEILDITAQSYVALSYGIPWLITTAEHGGIPGKSTCLPF